MQRRTEAVEASSGRSPGAPVLALYQSWSVVPAPGSGRPATAPSTWSSLVESGARPADLGTYDTGDRHRRAEHASLAAQFGVDGFCIALAGGHEGAEARDLLERIAAAGDPSFRFAVWLQGTSSAPDPAPDALADLLATAMASEGHVRLEGRPVLLVTDPSSSAMARLMDGLERRHGLRPESFRVARCDSTTDLQSASGAATCTVPLLRFGRCGDDDRHHAAFRSLLGSALSAGSRVVLVDSWNNWGRGTQLEPEVLRGRSSLLATAAAVRPRLEPGSPAREALLAGELILDRITEHAQRRLPLGDIEAVLGLARAASDWACHQTGALASEELDELLEKVAAELPPPASEHPAYSRRRIVHVLTRAVAVGGHTRFLSRWMRLDRCSDHVVVLTDQGDEEVPVGLLDVAVEVTQLREARLADRVLRLRDLASGGDVVVSHALPYDVIAATALSSLRARRVSTITMNHADHLFALGRASCDLLVGFRPVGLRVALARRGLEPGHVAMLPIPVLEPDRHAGRGAARDRLGIDAAAPVMLLLAASYKFASPDSPDLVETLAEVLEAVPEAHLVGVGIGPSEHGYQLLQQRFTARVHLLGSLPDPSEALAAADVYVDSWPFASSTSLLEAVAAGMPGVSYQPEPQLDLMYADDPSLEPLVARDRASLVSILVEVLRDPGQRARAWQRQAEGLAAHTGQAWVAALEHCYARAAERATPRPVPVSRVITPVSDAFWSLHHAAGIVRSWRTLLEHHRVDESGTSWSGELIADLERIEPVPAGAGRPDAKGVRTGPPLASGGAHRDLRWLSGAVAELWGGSAEPILDTGCHVVGLLDELARRGIPVVQLRDGREQQADEGAAARTRLDWLVADRAAPPRRYPLALCVGTLQLAPLWQAELVVHRLSECCDSFIFGEPIGARPSEQMLFDAPATWARRLAARGIFRLRGAWSPEGRRFVVAAPMSPGEAVAGYERELQRQHVQHLALATSLQAERDQARHQQHLTWLEYRRLAESLPPVGERAD